MFTINAASHPHFFKLVVELDYANGCVNRLEPQRDELEVPSRFASLLEEAEAQLAAAQLDDEEIQTFVDGDSNDIEALAYGRHILSAYELLGEYFNGWEEEQ